MKTAKTFYFGVLVALSAMLVSCSEVRYKYYIQNTTDYTIHYGLIDGAQKFALAPGQADGPFHGYHKPNLAWFFSQPFFTLSVDEYSNGDSIYSQRFGTLHDKSFIKDGETYRFDIVNTPNDTDTVRFALDIRLIVEDQIAKK